jgi:tRNA(Ile)-lysidine synthase
MKTFIDDYSLIDKDNLVLGVSAGIDSMVLLVSLFRCGYSCESVFINHGTRSTQNQDQNLVQKLAKHLKVKNSIFHLKDLKKSNFENNARIERYKIFNYIAADSKLICLGHHIDDSHEWSLMQSFKSSNPKSSLGIPVRNKNVIRPLMCLTKNQIIRYAKEVGIPYLEDPTNTDNDFERNYIRNEIVPRIKHRHPQYLKHYVNRSNELARLYKLHVNNSESHYQTSTNKDSYLIYNLENSLNFSGLENAIIDGMKQLNPDSRGVLSEQIKKIIQAMKNHRFGPLSLTSGIKAYVSFNAVLLSKNTTTAFKTKRHKDLSLNQFKSLLCAKFKQHSAYPYIVILDSGARSFSLNKNNYPYNAAYSKQLLTDSVEHQYALKLLAQWTKPKNKNKRLDLTF